MFGHVDKEPIRVEEKELLDKIHYDKIKLSDEIFVIDVDNYIGNSTRDEIIKASALGKNIRYFTKEKADFDKWLESWYERRINNDWNK